MNLLEACCSSPELWEELLLGIQPAIIVTDLTGNMLFVSPVAEKILKFAPTELQGKELAVIFTPEDISCLYPNILCTARKKKTFEGNVMLVRADGSRFIAYLTIRPYFERQAADAIIIFFIQDVSHQRELERLSNQTHYEDLVKLANGIAHEIRNPLVGIGGFLNRLFKSDEDLVGRQEYYGHIINNFSKIEKLVKKVQLFAQLPKPYFAQESTSGLIESAVHPYMDEIDKLQIDLVIEKSDFTIRVDKELVIRSISILIENALDALCDSGKIVVFCEQKYNEVVISVSDNGVGIPATDLPYVFNPFFSTKADGAGIDLAVVKRIMTSHGGCVDVSSKPNEGATFSLSFPVERRNPLRISLLSDADD